MRDRTSKETIRELPTSRWGAAANRLFPETPMPVSNPKREENATSTPQIEGSRNAEHAPKLPDHVLYWRHISTSVFGWGTATSLIFAGWTISFGHHFDIWPDPDDLPEGIDALSSRLVALSVFLLAAVIGAMWFVALRWIYKQHLKGYEEHPGIVSWQMMSRCALIVWGFGLIIATLLAFV